jgi:hypothetical protein
LFPAWLNTLSAGGQFCSSRSVLHIAFYEFQLYETLNDCKVCLPKKREFSLGLACGQKGWDRSGEAQEGVGVAADSGSPNTRSKHHVNAKV